MASQAPAYGLWALVVINVAVFAIFAFSFTHPRSACDWRSFGAFTAFLVALALIGAGFVLLAAAWRVLYAAQQTRQLATTGPYAYVRHPQYVGFILIMLGFFLQWPTLLRRGVRAVCSARAGVHPASLGTNRPASASTLGRLLPRERSAERRWTTSTKGE